MRQEVDIRIRDWERGLRVQLIRCFNLNEDIPKWLRTALAGSSNSLLLEKLPVSEAQRLAQLHAQGFSGEIDLTDYIRAWVTLGNERFKEICHAVSISRKPRGAIHRDARLLAHCGHQRVSWTTMR